MSPLSALKPDRGDAPGKAEGSRLKQAVKRCHRVFFVVGAFSVVINLLMLTSSIYMLQVFDRVLTSRSVETLIYLTVIAFVAFVALGALDRIRTRIMIALGRWLDRSVSAPVLNASIRSSLERGDASMWAIRDIATLRNFIAGPAVNPILDAPWTPVFLAVIFMLHSTLGLIATGGALLLFALALLNEILTRKALGEGGVAHENAMRHAEATVRNADVVEAMGMGPQLVQRWLTESGKALDLTERAGSRSGTIGAISKFLRQGLQVGILGGGAWLALKGELTPGAMIAASILMARALAPVEQSISSWRAAIGARGAYRRIEEKLVADDVDKPAMRLPPPRGWLSVENVVYTYAGAKEPILKGITFDLEPGESLGLVGPTAAGKTTLARALVGNLQPTRGHVRLDGADVSQWPSAERGRYIGYLPQDVELFSGTVWENIARMGVGDAEEVVQAAKLADIHEMILQLPKGYDTQIGEGGAVLSGGQRQRLGLARAVYGSPTLVVLDEPNASLDHIGEDALVSAFKALQAMGATVVVIAHRPSILRVVDKILVMHGGKMGMLGPRDEVFGQATGQPAGQPSGQKTGKAGGGANVRQAV